MQIFIKTLTGCTYTLDVDCNNSIDSVKDNLQNISGIPYDQ